MQDDLIVNCIALLKYQLVTWNLIDNYADYAKIKYIYRYIEPNKYQLSQRKMI